jgi:hypothetical protein
MRSTVITIPNVQLDLEQLIAAIRQADEQTRIQIAQVLVETQMDAKLAHLIDQLAQTTPAKDITDADIEAEIKAVRQLNK